MNKSNVTITLYMSELLYDVQNKTYLTGRSRQNGQNHEEVANMQANDDDENLNQLYRSIQNAFSTLKTKLSEYIESNASSSTNELISEETDELHLTLAMPTNYNHATVDTISSAMHQYVVNIATSEFFTITNKADAGDYVALGNSNLELIRESLNKRVRPTRRGAESMSSRFGGNGNVSTPTITKGTTTASISCSTNGAVIHYTTDGNTPTSASPVYSTPIEISEGMVIKAIATKSGMYDSAVATLTIT